MTIRKGSNIIAGCASSSNIAETIKDQNNTLTPLKAWTGTRAQYNALVSGGTIDSDIIYTITDDANLTTTLLETLYPVGSIYIGTMSSCPLVALFGTWTLVAANRVLQGSGANSAGTTVEAGLPNITGSFLADRDNLGGGSQSGALYKIPESGGDFSWPLGGSGEGTLSRAGLGLDASRSNSIYGNSNTVQPPAYIVNIWERTA